MTAPASQPLAAPGSAAAGLRDDVSIAKAGRDAAFKPLCQVWGRLRHPRRLRSRFL